jgi:hypothetical protein
MQITDLVTYDRVEKEPNASLTERIHRENVCSNILAISFC